MARETSYFVQAFNAGRGGSLKADAPIACKTGAGALRTAERLALSKVGVIAFSSTGDPEMGDYDDEPTVIFRQGELPSAFDWGQVKDRKLGHQTHNAAKAEWCLAALRQIRELQSPGSYLSAQTLPRFKLAPAALK